MKTIKISALFAVLISLFSFTSCSVLSDNNPNPVGVQPAPGAWTVSFFFDKTDRTSNYAGYTFEFHADGQLSATLGSQSWTGTWTIGLDDSKNKFLINFPDVHPSALAELEEDWLVIEQTESFLHFEHTSGGNGDTDVLQLNKN